MEVAVVVETGQVVALGDLLGAPAVEHVLDRDRDVVGEDLEQVARPSRCSRPRPRRFTSSSTPQTSVSIRIGIATSDSVEYSVSRSIVPSKCGSVAAWVVK